MRLDQRPQRRAFHRVGAAQHEVDQARRGSRRRTVRRPPPPSNSSGRHVERRPLRVPVFGRAALAPGAHVHEHDAAAALADDVAGLHVAVEQVAVVDGRERGGEVAAGNQRGLDGPRAAPLHHRVHRVTVDQFHPHAGRAVEVPAPNTVTRCGWRSLASRWPSRSASSPRSGVGVEQLERHLATELRVPGTVDGGRGTPRPSGSRSSRWPHRMHAGLAGRTRRVAPHQAGDARRRCRGGRGGCSSRGGSSERGRKARRRAALAAPARIGRQRPLPSMASASRRTARSTALRAASGDGRSSARARAAYRVAHLEAADDGRTVVLVEAGEGPFVALHPRAPDQLLERRRAGVGQVSGSAAASISTRRRRNSIRRRFHTASRRYAISAPS